MENLDKIIKKHLKSLSESDISSQENKMFFSNLEQIKRQCEMLLKMNPQLLDSIIQDGHDWADDHVTEAKTNMDQVFDFFMNKTKEMEREMNTMKADLSTFNLNEEDLFDDSFLNEENQIDESKNCPTDPGKWAASKAAAKAKFDVYPSAYANGWAAKNYKSKGGRWRKCK